MISETNPVTFEGVNNDAKVVLALRAEWINKKVYSIIFTERVAGYIIANNTNGRGIKEGLRKLQGTNPVLKSKHKSTSLTNEGKKDKDKVKMQQE